MLLGVISCKSCKFSLSLATLLLKNKTKLSVEENLRVFLFKTRIRLDLC